MLYLLKLLHSQRRGEWEFSKQRLPTSWESVASPGADSTGELCYQLFVLAGDQRENFLNDFSI